MSQLPPAHLSPSDAKAADAPAVEPGFEVVAHEFWVRNRNFILLVITAALLVLAGREGWAYFAAGREADVQADYAKAGDNADRLAAFADAHAGHALAGIACLRAADDKFTAADYKTAGTYYTKAAASLTNEALLGRARLGAAVSQLAGGDQAGGEAALKVLAADVALFKGVRAEANYDLASLAAAAGRTEDVRKFAEEASRVDENGPWAQRATVLLAALPAPAAPAAGASPGITFKPAIPDKPAATGKP